MGTHHYGIQLPPANRIMQNLVPEEGIGPLRRVPHDQLSVGIYDIEKTNADTLPPALSNIFNEFKRQLGNAAAGGQLPEVKGVMIVEDWQADLKRVTFRIIWTDSDSRQRKTLERIAHVHRHRRDKPT
jgi:hypothetical protein